MTSILPRLSVVFYVGSVGGSMRKAAGAAPDWRATTMRTRNLFAVAANPQWGIMNQLVFVFDHRRGKLAPQQAAEGAAMASRGKRGKATGGGACERRCAGQQHAAIAHVPAGQAAMSVASATEYPCEWQRITLVGERDGLERGIDFCAQTARIYRGVLLGTARRGNAHPHFATLPGYRAKFIASYLDFRRFVRAHQRAIA